MKNWDPQSEHEAGVLCSDGFMKERYDSKLDELVRTFTPKGIDVVKDILKDPEYQKIFIKIIKKESEGLSEEQKVNLILELKEMLC